MQEPANLDDERAGHRGRSASPGSSVRARCSRCTASATVRRSQAYPSDPPEGASDADCIVVIGTA